MDISYIYVIRVLDYVYVGKHLSHKINDSYCGSGNFIKDLREILPIQFFHRQILEVVKEEELNQKEQFYIEIFSKAFPDKCLNIIPNFDKEQMNKRIFKLKSIIKKIDENKLKEFTEKLFFKYFDYHKDFSEKEINFYVNLYDKEKNKIKNLRKEKLAEDFVYKILNFK